MNARLKELPPSRPKVNQVQRRYLKDRLEQAARAKRDVEDEPMPPDLKRMDKRIEAWRSAQYERSKKQRARIAEARKQVEEAILFMTPDEALAAVQAFEKLTV